VEGTLEDRSPDAEDRIGDEWLSWEGDYLSTVKPESAMAFSRSACFALRRRR